jgi:hypothetical protein
VTRIAILLVVASVALTESRVVSALDEIFPGRPIRLEGYVDPPSSSSRVLEEITISAGRDRRRFGVTALQAYKPEEEGAQVLRHSTLRPVTLLLRGPREMVNDFAHAPPGARLTAFGVYMAGPGTLTLTSVEIAGRERDAAR